MQDLTAIKDKIVETMLDGVKQRGWSWEIAEEAAAKAGFQDAMAKAVFPAGLTDAVAHFSDMIDRRMLARLDGVSTEGIRVRDRIRLAIRTRLDIFEEMDIRAVVKASTAYWALPMRVFQGQRVLWRSADRIWNWAGDTSKDYNRYTKRGLLASLTVGTTLAWIENPDDPEKTDAFLDRRIENIMEIGKTIGTIAQKLPDSSQRSAMSPKTRF